MLLGIENHLLESSHQVKRSLSVTYACANLCGRALCTNALGAEFQRLQDYVQWYWQCALSGVRARGAYFEAWPEELVPIVVCGEAHFQHVSLCAQLLSYVLVVRDIRVCWLV